MGKKLDALLGRSFKATKFRALVNLAYSRIAVLTNRHQVKSTQSRSDVIQLLQLSHHDRALLRVEQVIKEQSLLDAYAIMESYCNVLVERINLLERERECPEELKEAISGLLFASSRCGDFPELQEIRSVFTSRFGKEFTARATELRNNCAVNPVMVQKLSARPPSLEIKLKLLKQIADENDIPLKGLEAYGDLSELQEKDESKEKQKQQVEIDVYQVSPNEMDKDERFSDSMKGRKKYKDVADAAQAAFESAAHAAAAARAAVELSRFKSMDDDDDDQSSPSKKRSIEARESMNTGLKTESENEETAHEGSSFEANKSETVTKLNQSMSSSSSDMGEVKIEIPIEPVNIADLLEKDLVFDESDCDLRE